MIYSNHPAMPGGHIGKGLICRPFDWRVLELLKVMGEVYFYKPCSAGRFKIQDFYLSGIQDVVE